MRKAKFKVCPPGLGLLLFVLGTVHMPSSTTINASDGKRAEFDSVLINFIFLFECF